MKFFFFIFSFFMIGLSCLPCGDSGECNATNETEISAVEHHDHNSHETEACTPFCSCACCAVPAHVQQPSYTRVLGINFQSLKPLSNDDFHSYTSHSIWQPPKIC